MLMKDEEQRQRWAVGEGERAFVVKIWSAPLRRERGKLSTKQTCPYGRSSFFATADCGVVVTDYQFVKWCARLDKQ